MTAHFYDASQEQFECAAMAASSNSWLHQNLLPQQHTSQQQQQQQNSNHSLFHHSELPPLHHSQPGPLQHMNLGHGMDSHPPLHHGMHSALHMPGELHQQQQQQQQQQPHLPAQNSGQRAGGQSENGDAASVRKVHKADREKLRRDRLNEQFGELAGVLDPDRPKNDKATILGDSVQVVKELRSEVKRLKCEQSSLMDESRDLQQEKTELREEKAALKTETEQLQTQLQQRLRGMVPWMTMDPTAALMGAAPYPYAMPVPPQPPPPAATSQPLSETPPPPPPPAASQPPPPAAVVGPSPFLSLAPPGVYMHPFMPYPPPYAAGNHSHVERPYAQYPSGYLVQMPQGGGGGGPGAAVPIYRPPYPVLVPPRGGPGYPPPPPHVQVASSPEAQGVETSLQLQTPGGSAASEPAPQRGTQAGESKTPEGAELELTPPGTKESSDVGSKPDDGGESISALSLASKLLSRTVTGATVPSGVAGAAAEGSQQQPHGADATILRPAATE